MEEERAPLLSSTQVCPPLYGPRTQNMRVEDQNETNSTDSSHFGPGVIALNQDSLSDIDESHEISPDSERLQQASVFLEDAIHYRSIQHRVDKSSLVLYQIYFSRLVQWSLYLVIAVLHLLGFVENPSSLTRSSDLRLGNDRPKPPCGATESVELLCLLILLADVIIKAYLRGKAQTMRSYWLLGYFIVIVFSLIDWTISISLLCDETMRIRRMMRPYFLLQRSSLMKKTVKSLKKTMPQVISVLLLLFMHLYFFTLFGMLLFPKQHKEHNSTLIHNKIQVVSEHKAFFSSLDKGFMNLLVLLTTANNPDVTMPAYNENRFYSFYFIIFLGIGLYCLLNMLTAVIYNQFRGYFSDSIQASYFRRHLALRAAFEVLRTRQEVPGFRSRFPNPDQGVILTDLKSVIMGIKMKWVVREAILREVDAHRTNTLNFSEYKKILSLLDMNVATLPRPPLREMDNPVTCFLQNIFAHKNFAFFGCFVAAVNVLIITLELALEFDHVASTRDNYLGVFNLAFIIYYGVEQVMKCWAMGWQRYCWDRGNLFDAAITLALIIIELSYLIIYGVPYTARNDSHPIGVELWDMVRITNMLILVRLARMVVTQIKTMFIVASTLLDLIKNLRAFAGLMVVLYYTYALIGMELFKGAITYEDVKNMTNKTDYTKQCGTFEQLEYWSNNFDDLMSALIVLWDVMIVNNWHIFLEAYSRYTTEWSQIYFIVWWLLSVVFSANLFTALILENFIMRWDKRNPDHTVTVESSVVPLDAESFQTNYITVHQMFREGQSEPSEAAIMAELRQHPYIANFMQIF